MPWLVAGVFQLLMLMMPILLKIKITVGGIVALDGNGKSIKYRFGWVLLFKGLFFFGYLVLFRELPSV